MQDPAIICLSPDRANIKLSVKPCPSIPSFCEWVAEELLKYRSKAVKTVVFCRSLSHCANMCMLMRKLLGQNITEPPGHPDNMIKYRLVDVFTAASSTEMREEVLAEFCKCDSSIQLLIASTAFSLGVDCKDISRIINYATPNTLQELVQKLGRVGRNGSPAEAILYHKFIGKGITNTAKAYGENHTMCRRTLLFKNFLFSETIKIQACKCCDICEPLCNCVDCNNH